MKPLISLLITCLVLPVAARAAKTAPSAPADQAAVVEGNNAFAVELYNQLRNQSGNLFFSPESISTALAMTYAGARGDTASEIADTLHFTLPPDRLHPAMGALLSDLNAAHDGYELRVADALWAEKDYTFLDAFLKLTSRDYGAGFNQVDFKGAHEAARLTINQWVEQKTDNKIKDLLQPGVLDTKTRLVLTNAIYFKGDWQTPFDKAQTRNEDFRLSPEQTIKTPLMHRAGGFNYLNGGTFQVLEIPYKSAELSMIVLLPNDAGSLPALERSLTAYNMRQWLGHLRPVSNVILTLPKFKMTRQFELQDALAAMGMPQAFDKKAADFSGMASRKTMLADGNLYISAVIHKAYVDVDEEGTEAAAATAVVMRSARTGHHPHPPPIIFRADHPFMFLIRDNRSGSILFMGRVTNPNTSPENTQQGVMLAPGGASASAPETLEQRVEEFKERQQKLLQGAENIVFSEDRSTTDIIRSYPFLNGSLKGVNAVRLAWSPGNGTGVDRALPNTLGQSRMNLLFVYKKGPLVLDNNACGPNGCGLDVYADDGTGYKKALDSKYMGSDIHVSRANGQVELFIERSGEQREFVLLGDSSTGRLFAFRLPPHARDCCGPARTRP